MARHPTSGSMAHTAAFIELRFTARSQGHRSLAFPCDAAGRVDMDALDNRQRNDYLYARALMGRDYAFPVVEMRSC